jgi:hypothetical protein
MKLEVTKAAAGLPARMQEHSKDHDCYRTSSLCPGIVRMPSILKIVLDCKDTTVCR